MSLSLLEKTFYKFQMFCGGPLFPEIEIQPPDTTYIRVWTAHGQYLAFTNQLISVCFTKNGQRWCSALFFLKTTELFSVPLLWRHSEWCEACL